MFVVAVVLFFFNKKRKKLCLRQHPLGRRDAAPPPRIPLARDPQRPRERLERRLNDVVRVGAGQLPDVQRHARRIDQALEEVLDELRLVGANPLCGELQVAREVRPAAEVEYDVHERLVERRREVAEARDAPAVSQCARERRAKRERDVLVRVVVVDPRVPRGLDGDVEQAVRRELVEHVVEERDRRARRARARAVDRDGDVDRRLLRDARDSSMADQLLLLLLLLFRGGRGGREASVRLGGAPGASPGAGGGCC